MPGWLVAKAKVAGSNPVFRSILDGPALHRDRASRSRRLIRASRSLRRVTGCRRHGYARPVRAFARVKLWLAVTSMAAFSTARADGPHSPDHARLGVFVGKWDLVGDMAPSTLSPVGRFAAIHVGAWDFGGHFVVMRYNGTDNGRPVSQIDLYGWDPDSKRYTYDAFSSLGQRASFIGSVAGDTWTWSAERNVGDTPLLIRMVQHLTADGTMSWTIETSKDGT